MLVLLTKCVCILGAKLTSVTAIHVYNMTADTFNFEKLPPEPRKLISLSITNSHINRVFGRIAYSHEIACLNLSNNAFGAEWQEPLALESLKKLSLFDFSNVNITRLPLLKIQVPLFWLDISSKHKYLASFMEDIILYSFKFISDNKKVQCDSVLDLMTKSRSAKYKLYFAKYNETFCASSLSFHWFNSTEKVALSQVEIINKVL